MKLAWTNAFRLALLPGAIALGVTLLRLAGELGLRSDTWFARSAGIFVPSSAVDWIAGIAWLAPLFGVYFSWRLARVGDRPDGPAWTILRALLAALVLYAGTRLSGLLSRPPALSLFVWGSGVAAAAIAWRAWPPLARALAAYGMLSRLPVAVAMLLAMHSSWGLRYGNADMPQAAALPFGMAYLLLALVPQLVFWVALTIVAGMLAGSLAAAIPVRPFAPAGTTVRIALPDSDRDRSPRCPPA
jgi:hypothetical protein